MGLYLYTNLRTGDTVERAYAMQQVPPKIRVKGRVYWRDLSAEERSRRPVRKRLWPQAAIAYGVNPKQRQRAQDHDRKLGVPTHYNDDGDPVFHSSAHQKNWERAHRFLESLG